VWRQVRDETKYDRMISFGEALPSIRERVAADLSRQGLPREKVLAAVARSSMGPWFASETPNTRERTDPTA